MSTKNWWEVEGSNWRIQPGGRSRAESSILRRMWGGIPLRVLCCRRLLETERWVVSWDGASGGGFLVEDEVGLAVYGGGGSVGSVVLDILGVVVGM